MNIVGFVLIGLASVGLLYGFLEYSEPCSVGSLESGFLVVMKGNRGRVLGED